MFQQALQGVALAPVVLWKTKGITCTCQRHTADLMEVQLVVVGVVVQREFFHDVAAASQFAIDKMRAYNVS